MSEAQYWQSTPREMDLRMRARARTARAEWRRTLAAAWHVAALSRVRELPDLADVLEPPAPRDKEDLAAEFAEALRMREAARNGR